MAKMKELIHRISEVDATLHITGESGTGKELVAHAVHRHSRNAAGPFVAINCAAIPEALLESDLFGHVKGAFTDARTPRQGLFLKANGGTLFLDEIGEMPLGMQPKLLRALQERTVRPVGGDLEIPFRRASSPRRIAISKPRSSRSGFAKICFIASTWSALPCLRCARAATTCCCSRNTSSRNTRHRMASTSPGSRRRWQRSSRYAWPGNVRELQNCIERAVAFTRFDELTVDDLPDKVRDYRSLDLGIPGVGTHEVLTMEEVERRHCFRVLKSVDGNKTTAAELLGIHRRTLYRRLEAWGYSDGPEAEPAESSLE